MVMNPDLHVFTFPIRIMRIAGMIRIKLVKRSIFNQVKVVMKSAIVKVRLKKRFLMVPMSKHDLFSILTTKCLLPSRKFILSSKTLRQSNKKLAIFRLHELQRSKKTQNKPNLCSSYKLHSRPKTSDAFSLFLHLPTTRVTYFQQDI